MSRAKGKRKLLSAKLASWWHPTLNGDLRPEDVSGGSGQTVWFRHYNKKRKQWHEWSSTPDAMSLGENCPICTGSRVVPGINDLMTRNRIVADLWHPTLNGDLTAQMVTEHSGKTVWWQHYDEKTGIWHEWTMRVVKLTSKKPSKCAVCRGVRIQIGANDLATTHSTLASEWHPRLNGALTAQMITKGSEKQIWWKKDCFKNGIYHCWYAKPCERTRKNSRGCAICSGKQVQLGVNDLASKYPALALEWDKVKNKNLTPQMVTESSHKKVFWKHKATNGARHSWPATIYGRTGSTASGCPECSKTGFDSAKAAHLYVLSATLKESQVIQFGISNDVKTRLVKHVRSGFTNPPVTLISFSKGADARSLEVSLLNLLKDYHIPTATKQGIKFDGSTEAFRLEDTDEEFLSEFMELVG